MFSGVCLHNKKDFQLNHLYLSRHKITRGSFFIFTIQLLVVRLCMCMCIISQEHRPCWGNTWQWSAASHWFSLVHGLQRFVLVLLQEARHSPASPHLLLSVGRLSSNPYPAGQKKDTGMKRRIHRGYRNLNLVVKPKKLQWESDSSLVYDKSIMWWLSGHPNYQLKCTS